MHAHACHIYIYWINGETFIKTSLYKLALNLGSTEKEEEDEERRKKKLPVDDIGSIVKLS